MGGRALLNWMAGRFESKVIPHEKYNETRDKLTYPLSPSSLSAHALCDSER